MAEKRVTQADREAAYGPLAFEIVVSTQVGEAIAYIQTFHNRDAALACAEREHKHGRESRLYRYTTETTGIGNHVTRVREPITPIVEG